MQSLTPYQATLTVSPAEFFDRLAILYVKTEKISDPGRLQAARSAYEKLQDSNPELTKYVKDHSVPEGEPLRMFLAQLISVHMDLWDVENKVRGLDGRLFFRDQLRAAPHTGWVLSFLRNARQVYILNDRRTEIKKQIDELFGQEPEVKEYASYPGHPASA